MVMNGKEISKEELDDYAHEAIDDLFKKVAEDFDIKHGDVDPAQAQEIDRFKEVIKHYVRRNSD